MSLRRLAVPVFLLVALGAPRSAQAFSVLAHEAMVDAAWDGSILPILKQRYPRASEQDLLEARAYAYGGSIIQDLGYYPFGSHFFTNLVHYVRPGDFVESMIGDARDVNELAFALGALAHYASDRSGHSLAVNRLVPRLYPKDRARFGDQVLYAQAKSHHLMTEFSIDVLQVARGAYVSQAYHAFIGFEVAKPLLERAFQATYGLPLKDMFADLDLAIGTYRWAVGTTIPEITRIAWRDKQKEIEQRTPGVQRGAFLYRLERQQFEQEFGTKYQRPGFFSRLLGWFIKVLPKVGPFRALAFEPLDAQSEQLFLDSAARALDVYREALGEVRARRLMLANVDLDTGEAYVRGRNTLADETLDELRMKVGKATAVAARQPTPESAPASPR